MIHQKKVHTYGMQGIFYPLFYRANIPPGYFLVYHGGKRVSRSFSLLGATLQAIEVILSAAYIELT
jgi:hypothetical protein